ncbi:penicillin-insensitive murein endopeptidase [Lujinxingia vulgaris]|uniref:Penicillin-insensitive murein endopeptidase n=1 Tax=Lujinxingia vulgaris TaxID=2600176 RepID=A0A5C6XQU7_9DELT|nr:penicillin-insensitive murein endopeptidase [Lujinxingia vulgaris]TXD43636.1 penicillin-insensitive murein endopeptidase [Lujinxingia vulgaris]
MIRLTLVLSALLLGASCAATAPAVLPPASGTTPSATAAPSQHLLASQPPPSRVAPLALTQAARLVDHALQESARSVGSAWGLPHEPLDALAILDPERRPAGSLSLGTIRQGRLLQPATLPVEGPYHSIIERHRSRNTHYGTRELIAAVERAAERVAREFGGAPLRVGNIAFAHGGPIPWSSSHQAGRDVDLAFYALDPQGHSVPTPDLIHFDDEGYADGYPLTFDVARNWALARALLTDPEIRVQWLFVSEGLKRLMLDHAVALGEPADLVERASAVLHQPTDAPPHADHLHVRIGCPLADRLEGCQDWGPRWPWYDWHDERVLARALALRPALSGDDPRVARRALDFLEQLKPPMAGELILFHSFDAPQDELRERALELLQKMPPRTRAGALAIARHLRRTDLPQTARRPLYNALAAASTPDAFEVARARLFDASLPLDERLLAAEALRFDLSPDLVSPLLAELQSAPAPLRAPLAELLYRVTARYDGLDWKTAGPTDQNQALAQWHQWWQQHRELPRQQWLKHALANLAIDAAWGDLHHVDTLISQLPTLHPALAMNLSHVISDWTGRWAPRDFASPADAHRYWTRWWGKNRDRMLQTSQPQAWR